MYVLDFVIPLTRGDLCEASPAGQYSVTQLYSIPELRERLDASKIALSEEGTDFIIDHFDTFFSLFQIFKQVPDVLKVKGWNTITKAFKLLSNNLHVLLEDISNVDNQFQNKMCNITKMILYVLIELMKLFQDKYMDQSHTLVDGKGKKKLAKAVEESWDWNDEKHKVLVEIYNFLHLPLKLLWEPPVVDEEFVNLIGNICYKFLEDPSISGVTMKQIKEDIIKILGVLIKQYLHGLSFCVKVVQLLRMNEHLVNPLAHGVVALVRDCHCQNIVKEIVREIAETDGDQLAADAVGTRSLNLFLVQVAEVIPDTIVPTIDLLLHHLSGDSYTMRTCVLGVLGEIVLTVLTKENLDENLKQMRDEFLDALVEHVQDVHAFVRTKVLQIWQKLCLAKAIPISRLNTILELSVSRLKDKSTNVKKHAVHLIKTMLEGNPFSGQLSTSEIRHQLKDELEKLEILKKAYSLDDSELAREWKLIKQEVTKVLSNPSKEGGSGGAKWNTVDEAIQATGQHLLEGEYWKAVDVMVTLRSELEVLLGVEKGDDSNESLCLLLQKIFEQTVNSRRVEISSEDQEKIEKQHKTVEYLECALHFAELIDRALPIILTFLDSTVVTDVLESIHFFTAAYLFGFHKALEGVRKVLYLVFSKEANVKAAVSAAYRDLYFQTNASGRQHSLTAVKNLSDLVLKLNSSQFDALEEVVQDWVKTDVIDKSFIQVLFERFSMKITGTSEAHSWAALVLIRMVGAAEPKVIGSNISVLLNQGLGDCGRNSLLLAKETCKALQRLVPKKQEGDYSEQSYRYPMDNEMFVYVHRVLRDGLWLDDCHYVPMAEEAINLVFVLCDRPDRFAEQLLLDLHGRIASGKRPLHSESRNKRKMLSSSDRNLRAIVDDIQEPSSQQPTRDDREMTAMVLTRFVTILGQVACNFLLYLESTVLNELKRRNQVDYEKRAKRFIENKKCNISLRKGKLDVNHDIGEKTLQETGAEELEFNRVAADDVDLEEMRRKTERDIVNGNGFLAKFAPLILGICKNPGKYGNSSLQNAALLTVGKYMQVSSVFCEENIQLFMTICEKSQCPKRRENAMIVVGSLVYRFPNSLEPWTPHMYAMLRDPEPNVRVSAIIVLTDLIVNEMIKARNYISELAVCIVDKEIKIAQIARHFFREYAQKGNCLYNVLPSLISNLTQPNSSVNEDEFKVIMKLILGLITKEKHSEYLVEKLCQYLEAATSERQWKDLAYCLSLLSYTDKGLRKILENVRCYANKLYLAEVYEAFAGILTNAARNQHKDKVLITEIQDVIKNYRDKSCEDKNVVVVHRRKCPPSTSKRVARRKLMSSSEEDEASAGGPHPRCHNEPIDDDSDDAFVSKVSTRKSRRSKKTMPKISILPSAENSDSDEYPRKCAKKV